MKEFVVSILSIPFYPFILPFQVSAEPSASGFKKVFTVFFSFFILLPLWVLGYIFVGFTIWVFLQWGGVMRMEVPVTGASMLPTFDEEGYVAFYKTQTIEQLKPTFTRGDVVVFQNQRTEQEFQRQEKLRGGFVKRIIGMPGDVVVIRDGFVYVNGEMIDEPYTLQPRSTFGGDRIPDCNAVTVPPGKLLVMGDNRKVSMDSREIGFIDQEDVEFYLPFEEQQNDVAQRWRDTSTDKDHAQLTEFDQERYVTLLNEKRTEAGLQPLTYQPRLNETARKRAEVMLQYNDLSFEATRSGYTMKQAMEEIGYWNAVYGEVPTLGYYNEQELFDSFFEYESSRQFFLEPEYNEIGISTFVGDLNGCPVQIVVQHVAGYKPPNYNQQDITSWRNARSRLQQVQSGWRDLQQSGDFYEENKQQIDRINEVIALRIDRMNQIITRMEANQWLTAEEERYVQEDTALFEEQDSLANQINTRIE
jgi:signal peptidase I